MMSKNKPYSGEEFLQTTINRQKGAVEEVLRPPAAGEPLLFSGGDHCSILHLIYITNSIRIITKGRNEGKSL